MQLPANHHVRLGLVLNLSVFYHEIVNDTERAVSFASSQLDAAFEMTRGSAMDRATVNIVSWIRENLRNWRSGKRTLVLCARAQMLTRLRRAATRVGAALGRACRRAQGGACALPCASARCAHAAGRSRASAWTSACWARSPRRSAAAAAIVSPLAHQSSSSSSGSRPPRNRWRR